MRRIGFALDIDGPLRRANIVIPRARSALQALTDAQVPWVCLTNGGGEPEADKAERLSELLQFKIPESRMILSHTPMRPVVKEFADKRIMVIGCGKVKEVAMAYGARNVVTPDDIAASDPHVYPFRQWQHRPLQPSLTDLPIAAIFVLHDATDWAVEVQTVLDAKLYSGQGNVPIYASNPDIIFAGGSQHPRLAAGAFSAALTEVWRHVTGQPDLPITWYGKPTAATFDFAQQELCKQAGCNLDTIYMVGDNLRGDIRGANLAGDPWRSILISTGIWSPENVTWRERSVHGVHCKIAHDPSWADDEPWAAVDDVMSAVSLGLHLDEQRW